MWKANWKIIAIICCFAPLLYDSLNIGQLVMRQKHLSKRWADRSLLINSKYDNVTRLRFEFERNNKMKLSSNTFDNNAIKENLNNDFSPLNPKENATLLMLVRNEEIYGALDAMRELEDRFNRRYHYDWTFLNDKPFTPLFIKQTTAMASGKTQYALIPSEDWDRPDTVDMDKFEERLKKMNEEGVLYGDSKSYRNMCRFNSGYFFRQKILDQYDYYFRVEPTVKYFCDFPYDPFRVMREQKKKYGFVISLYEYENTIPTLWDTVTEYITKDNGTDIDMSTNSYKFITDKEILNDGDVMHGMSSNDYNLCHFWSNFEIGDLNFFRSDKYLNFFSHLDETNGFYYERWGDAPVHSIAMALLLRSDELIHFEEIAYLHEPYYTCPLAYDMRIHQRCRCNPEDEFNIPLNSFSCLNRWWRHGSGKYFMNTFE